MRLKAIHLVPIQALGALAQSQFPFNSENSHDIDSVSGKFDPQSCADVCPLANTINNNTKHSKELWNKIEVDGWLEVWLKAVPYSRWPNRIAKYIWKNDVPNFDYASLTGDCRPMDDNCHHLCRKHEKQPTGYFFYYAAEKFHETANALYDFYEELTLRESLNLDTIVSDWDGGSSTSSGADVLAIMSACLGVASTAVGAASTPGAPAAGVALSALSGLFSIASDVPGGGSGGNPIVSLQHLLDKFFTESEHLLTKLLKDVFGDGNPKDIPKSALTHVGRSSTCKSNICRFFTRGKWLFFDIDDHIAKFRIETRKRLAQALGVFAMNNKVHDSEDKGYIVVINTDVDKENCGSQNNMGHWTRGQCFNLFWYQIDNGGPPGEPAMHLWNVGDDWLQTFYKYGLSLEEYYDNVWDCATSHAVCRKGHHRAKWMGHEKGLPQCLFHTMLVKGSYDAESSSMQDIVDVCTDK